ncbi:MAG: ABC transporter ATP-binding protein [Candidatus Rokubacteria bacterium]|nr:ABC transporter ATP-binding protein [Candidatus Rokubacteria bacterium]
MTADPLLAVRGLTKTYYGLTAVDDLTFAVAAGTIVGLIGPNGSGKSTTIDCISGFQRPDVGRWFLRGTELTGRPAHAHARAGVARTFQTVRAYETLTLLDNLRLAVQEHDGVTWWQSLARSVSWRDAEAEATARAHELLGVVGLTNYAGAPAEILSYGQRKLLTIAASMMARPALVVLDEPVAGVNPTMIRRVEEVIRRVNAEGVTLLIVEHNVDFIMRLCGHVIVLDAGKKLAEGEPAEVRGDPRVLAAYLGRGRASREAARRD